MYIYNKYAYDFFRSQYLADTPEAAACRRYAERSLRIQPTVVGTRTFAELMAWGIAH